MQRQGLYLPLVDAASFASMRENVLQFRLRDALRLSSNVGTMKAEAGLI